MSAHPGVERGGFLSVVAARVTDFLLEPPELVTETAPVELEPHPVVAVLSAAPRCGATTVARALAAELAVRAGGAAAVSSRAGSSRRAAPPLRASARLATALQGVSADRLRAAGRLCLVAGVAPDEIASAARYLAPVVLDVPADGSGAAAAALADRVVVVASATDEPALAQALSAMVDGLPVRVTTRAVESAEDRPAGVLLPEARMAARSALAGARPLGPFGRAVSVLADALELDA